MLMVKTRLGPSDIAGIGLFAAEDIPKGTVTWRFMERFDRLLTEDEMESLPEVARCGLLDHVYLHEASGMFVLCADNARFMNHADHPNTEGVHEPGSIEGYDIASRDIRAGEEITCDYRTFDAHVDRKLGGQK
ncbi:MAG: SET domain-containing protein [Proteobacteria bacterium]|nr:SET domain-containing protein [Pseudomonadota bacterium]